MLLRVCVLVGYRGVSLIRERHAGQLWRLGLIACVLLVRSRPLEHVELGDDGGKTSRQDAECDIVKGGC